MDYVQRAFLCSNFVTLLDRTLAVSLDIGGVSMYIEPGNNHVTRTLYVLYFTLR